MEILNQKKDGIKTISLALGSGGARGYAHIGVIEELENKGYQILCLFWYIRADKNKIKKDIP